MSDLVQTGSEMLSVDCATILTVLQWSEVAVPPPGKLQTACALTSLLLSLKSTLANIRRF
jgi:hypothetical protein